MSEGVFWSYDVVWFMESAFRTRRLPGDSEAAARPERRTQTMLNRCQRSVLMEGLRAPKRVGPAG